MHAFANDYLKAFNVLALQEAEQRFQFLFTAYTLGIYSCSPHQAEIPLKLNGLFA